MRPTSSCTVCRSRKKRCITPQAGSSCKLCVSKRLKCDLANEPPTRTRRGFTPPIPIERLAPASVATQSSFDVGADSPKLGNETLPEAIRNELVDLYFDLIDEKQLILFHRDSFIAEQRAGRAPEYLVLAMITLMSRFSSNPYFESIHPWERARPWYRLALQSFYARQKQIDLPSIQGALLLGFVACVEGEPAQEALLVSQAICMVQVLHLPVNLSPNPIQREVEIRVFWEVWMGHTWHSSRAQIPMQLASDASFKRPLEEEVFRSMSADDPPERYSEDRIEALGLRTCGLWSSMLALTGIHGRVMRLNDDMVQRTISELESRARVKSLSIELDSWFRALPTHLQDTPENRAAHAQRGLGREFAVHHIQYNHQSQLLYYQFLNKRSVLAEWGTDNETMIYAARCKAHATALSQIFWDTNSCQGLECLWSPVNGHLLVVASSALIHTLLFETDGEMIDRAKKLLEQNFIMLLQFRKYWSLVELSMTRLHAFHRACQMNSTQESFDMDRWMIDFLNRYDSNVSDRYNGSHGEAGSYYPIFPLPQAAEVWQELSAGISATMSILPITG